MLVAGEVGGLVSFRMEEVRSLLGSLFCFFVWGRGGLEEKEKEEGRKEGRKKEKENRSCMKIALTKLKVKI